MDTQSANWDFAMRKKDTKSCIFIHVWGRYLKGDNFFLSDTKDAKFYDADYQRNMSWQQKYTFSEYPLIIRLLTVPENH